MADSFFTWAMAEELAVGHMRAIGFTDAKRTKPGADGGIDVTSSQAVAQVKHRAAPTGIAEIQRLSGIAGPPRLRDLLAPAGGGQTDAMGRVLEQDISWIREDTGQGGSIRAAVPGGYDVYGFLDFGTDDRANEDVLLAALAPPPDEQLIAGWIDRGPWMPPPGDRHVLYTGWPYRFQRVPPAQLRGLPPEGEGSFPDLLFPPDRSWFVTLLWDDSWRSIGADEATIRRIETGLPSFERVDPDTSIRSTGRAPN